MNEQAIFLAALEIEDLEERERYILEACADGVALRAQVEALLEAHDQSGEFLDVPALQQMVTKHSSNIDTAETEASKSELDMSFLESSDVPGSLGRLGRYDIREEIGRGGFGIVFKAYDDRLERIVAIKVLAPMLAAKSQARELFLREARATAMIRHENVVSIYDIYSEPLPFLVMEFIDGGTLRHMIDRTGRLDVHDVFRFGIQIASGLAAAHDRGIIHRDITPANILLDSETGILKLTDFGLARSADEADPAQNNVIAGTPLYMSPEQAQALAIDHRSDLFSLGSVLYYMCSGRPPFPEGPNWVVLQHVALDKPLHVTVTVPEAPDCLASLIGRLHTRNPDQRIGSASEVRDQLKRCFEDYKNGGPPIIVRSRWATTISIMLVLVTGFGFTEASGITSVRSTVIRLFSPEGTLVVEIDDPGVSLAIDGKAMVITGAGIREIRLTPGEHQLVALKNGEVVQQQLVVIENEGRQVVRVSSESAAPQVTRNPAKEDAPRSEAADPFPVGSYWLGERTYQTGLFQGSTVHYELFVDERDGNSFKGHVFDNGKGRNFAHVNGEINGTSLTWTEWKDRGDTMTVQGKLSHSTLEIVFNGRYPNKATNRGVAQLTRVDPIQSSSKPP